MKDPKSPSPVIIGGVDTHKELHVVAVVDATDTVLATESLSTTRAGYRAMLRWMRSYGETRQVDEARTNGRFHRYVVDNVRQGNPAAFRLIDLHGDVLARLLERARPQSYVTLPFPVGVYDAAVAKRD